DTCLGMRLNSAGIPIIYCDQLRGVHLKEYTLVSFFLNDFRIPFGWSRLFINHSGLGKLLNGGRFAHARLSQVVGLVLASTALATTALAIVGGLPGWIPLGLFAAAVGTNLGFLRHLARREGTVFAVIASAVSLADQVVMSLGVVSGIVSHLGR